MAREEEYEPSVFASDGRAPFPPTYEDNKHIGDFSNDGLWPTQKLMGRLALYQDFLKRDDIMPRARDTARRIREHLMFELLWREGYFDYLNEVERVEDEEQPENARD